MASSTGFQLTAGRIPGEQIAITTNVTDSGTWTTTETVADSVTAPLVSGRTYRIRWSGGLVSTVAADIVLVRMREDNVTGTLINERNVYISSTSTAGNGFTMEGRYTAVATADKTFVVSGIRNGGTGTQHADATGTRPRYLYVDYISG